MVRFKGGKVSSGSQEDGLEDEAGAQASQSCGWPRPRWGQQDGKKWAGLRDW